MNFRELLLDNNIPIAPEGHHHGRTGWIQIDCPFCGPDSHLYHMGYNQAYGYVNCWKCGRHSLYEVLEELLPNMMGREIRALIDDLPRERVKVEKKRGKLVKPKGLGPLLKPHKKYLQSRGFDWKELVHVWGIAGIGTAHRLSWRIWIPVYYHNSIVSWTTRTISKRPNINRYLSASEQQEEIPHKTLLYGQDYARQAILIVEGPIDAWRIGPGAVATFGIDYTIQQVRKMAEYPVRAICYDSEAQAQKQARKLYNTLIDFPGETLRIELDSKDAGEATEQEIKRLRRILK